MNIKQIILSAVFIPLTILITILLNIFPYVFFVDFLKHASIIALFLASLVIHKNFPEQKILVFALFFNVLGDLSLFINQTVIGVTFFIIAYLIVIVVCQKKPKATMDEFKINPILIILYIMFLIYIVWVSFRTILKGYYSKKVAIRFAAAGVLIFVSDLAVIADIFNISLTIQSSHWWLDNVIWATYIPAWTLITLNVFEDRFYLKP